VALKGLAQRTLGRAAKGLTVYVQALGASARQDADLPALAVDGAPGVGEFGFDFTQFGVRVPAVLVSPLIEAGTVFRVPAGTTPIDHTSMLKTVQERWGLPSLTARDAAAPSLGGGELHQEPRRPGGPALTAPAARLAATR